MAAAAWAVYNKFKEYVMDNTIDIDGDIFMLALYTSASNAATTTLSLRSQITNEVANANGYSTGGKTASAPTWGTGASAGEMRFDATATIWSASGGNIVDAKFAVLYDQSTGASAGAQKLIAQSQLSTAQFTITSGNTLTVTPSANGIFELN